MSVIFKVEASSGPYQVQVGTGLHEKSTKESSFSIVDELVSKLWVKSVPQDGFFVQAIEQN